MKVKNAMHRSAEWVSPQTPLREVAMLMRDKDVGAIPIGENDRLIGMVTDRDIACRCVADGLDLSKACARDVMSEGIQYCRENDDLQEAIERMGQKQVRRLPVINDQKRLVGMLSLGDVAAAASARETGSLTRAVAAHH